MNNPNCPQLKNEFQKLAQALVDFGESIKDVDQAVDIHDLDQGIQKERFAIAQLYCVKDIVRNIKKERGLDDLMPKSEHFVSQFVTSQMLGKVIFSRQEIVDLFKKFTAELGDDFAKLKLVSEIIDQQGNLLMLMASEGDIKDFSEYENTGEVTDGLSYAFMLKSGSIDVRGEASMQRDTEINRGVLVDGNMENQMIFGFNEQGKSWVKTWPK
ncbi:MAG: hypothetical protein WCG01_02235 [bacterium]